MKKVHLAKTYGLPLFADGTVFWAILNDEDKEVCRVVTSDKTIDQETFQKQVQEMCDLINGGINSKPDPNACPYCGSYSIRCGCD